MKWKQLSTRVPFEKFKQQWQRMKRNSLQHPDMFMQNGDLDSTSLPTYTPNSDLISKS